MSEISMYEAQKKKMQGLCDEHDLVYRFEKDRYPIIFTIKPVQGMDAQISMLENVEEVGYRSPDASMSWIFEDGGLDTKVYSLPSAPASADLRLEERISVRHSPVARPPMDGQHRERLARGLRYRPQHRPCGG